MSRFACFFLLTRLALAMEPCRIEIIDNYTFYNPRIQSGLTPDDASFILFEGTYSTTFADHAQPTPRHNYNQILYRLDLDDPKLAAKIRRDLPSQGSP